MPRTAEDACVEYAIVAGLVRAQTRIIRENRCTEASGSDDPFDGGIAPCFKASDDPSEWCTACKTSAGAVDARRQARKRLGVAKRHVEVAGKRLNLTPAHP